MADWCTQRLEINRRVRAVLAVHFINLSRISVCIYPKRVSIRGSLVKLNGAGDTPLSVDAESIGQILGNLVDNAAKYANDTTSPTIHLGATTGNGSLVVTVRDHGPGIPREQARTIFDPFERGGRDPADPVPGVGLGLALARGLARDMGGELTLESPSDGGARFRLELPATAHA